MAERTDRLTPDAAPRHPLSTDARLALDTIAGCLTAERPAYPMTPSDRSHLASVAASTAYGTGELDGDAATLHRELLQNMPPITGRPTRREYAETLRPAA